MIDTQETQQGSRRSARSGCDRGPFGVEKRRALIGHALRCRQVGQRKGACSSAAWIFSIQKWVFPAPGGRQENIGVERFR